MTGGHGGHLTHEVLALAALGAFHGVNPGMGWLFAVALGLQERSRAALLWALPAIGAGHFASVGVAAVAIMVTGSVVATQAFAIGGGVLLVGYGLWRLLSQRHFRWVGMRVSLWQLATWSFLMASIDGAGLMLFPVLGPNRTAGPADAVSHALTATTIHTVAMLAAAGAVALLVYEVLGVGILRRGWVNLDRVWALALIGAGAATIALAIW